MGLHKHIIVVPAIQHGMPVIRGTRVPVARIIAELAEGMTREEVMKEYRIAGQDIRAFLTYTAGLVESDEFHPLPAGQR